eukprot:gene18260-27793_t
MVENLIFAYGSLINPGSRKRSVPDAHIAMVAEIKPEFGYERAWCFRAHTGFTALGLRKRQRGEAGSTPDGIGINGVIHAACDSLSNLDAREAGYTRVEVPLDLVSLVSTTTGKGGGGGTVSSTAAEQAPGEAGLEAENETGSAEEVLTFTFCLDGQASAAATASAVKKVRLWTYVPDDLQVATATEEYPLVQTYLDVVMEGCLEMGGTAMANDFIVGTGGWSIYFLNDVHTSRRPWLHRPKYQEIDGLLRQHRSITQVDERRHPEEFAVAFLSSMRGMWGVPKRSTSFVGRERYLTRLQEQILNSSPQPSSASLPNGNAKQPQPQPQPQPQTQTQKRRRRGSEYQIVGLGGVGKTQMATEFCYQHYPSAFGLVVWLNAESADTLAAGIRKLAVDTGMEVRDKPNVEVIGEVRSRLFQARCAWLMVFDNLEDPAVIRDCAPQGTQYGHVLITGRRQFAEWHDRSINLECFDVDESIMYLEQAAGESAGIKAPCHLSLGGGVSPRKGGGGGVGGGTPSAGDVLAQHLGHLPLALAMASSYMRRCDVDCLEYLEKLNRKAKKTGTGLGSGRSSQLAGASGRVASYSHSLADSLSLSLGRIERENPLARRVLDTLCYLASDGHSKTLVKLILWKSTFQEENPRSFSPAGSTAAAAAAAAAVSVANGGTNTCAANIACAVGVRAGAGAGAAPPAGANGSINQPRTSDAPPPYDAATTPVRGTPAPLPASPPPPPPPPPPLLATPAAGGTQKAFAAMLALGTLAQLWRVRQRRQLRWSDVGKGAVALGAAALCSTANFVDRGLHPTSATSTSAPVMAGKTEEDGEAEEEEEDAFDMDEIEDVGEDADIIWGVLKSFSILSVRDRSGSIHRLLQQAVMDSHERGEATEAISRCLWALSQLWCFREGGGAAA